MQLPRLLLGSARRLSLGSAEAALCGELCGLWGETESLTPGPREGMGGVGAARCFRFLVRSRTITLGTCRFSARVRFLFLRIPGYWGLGRPVDAGRGTNIIPASSRRKTFVKTEHGRSIRNAGERARRPLPAREIGNDKPTLRVTPVTH